ncbi:hypothetical protein GE21DRAFT_6569 [Neurospora crassa]|uniref:Uncharacterized protein n=1 Tax=Neurospora crassa (strain ATCC 24698 / 74-OR23-1A / CBS 708.71 / DSM 1257 / FGSC 987) TaxID=367110 RepID=Q7S8E8_NEUCR|nr:hypothetical protein NCU08822 [Neurospora crassa OR74A]EAA32626.1 hypothetical protein NCU08822 [Neurospora crassa OR74A]KHE78781.1 hypothetical protein GE21DRAFT_6569 [Neurospora crassa]|eukprot:XP_961862.1 hypothetical protein NCU08822 [Neurospora crassa OR74A]
MAVEGGSEVPWKKACCQGKRAVLTTEKRASEQKRKWKWKWKWKLSCGREKAEVGRLKENGGCWLARDRKRGDEEPQTVLFSPVCDVGKIRKGSRLDSSREEGKKMETPDGKWRELRNIACSKKCGFAGREMESCRQKDSSWSCSHTVRLGELSEVAREIGAVASRGSQDPAMHGRPSGGGRAPKRRWSLMVRARFWGRQGYGPIDWPTEL